MLQRIQYDLRLFIPSLLGHPIRRLTFKQYGITIRDYIRNQEQDDKRLDQLNMWR